MIRRFAIATLLAIVLTGCDTSVQPPPPPAPPDTLAVYTVLHSGRPTQRALVSRPDSVPVSRPDSVDENEERTLPHVQDATVRIRGRTFTAVPPDSTADYLGADLLGRGANYEATQFAVAPGDMYELRVTRKDTKITGSARVPGSFTATVDSMTVRWTRSAGAARYVLQVQRNDDEGFQRYAYRRETLNTAATVDPAALSEPFRPGPHTVTIVALDSNLARFQWDSVRRAGLEGGFGVFGAVTVVRDTVSLPATGETDGARARGASP